MDSMAELLAQYERTAAALDAHLQHMRGHCECSRADQVRRIGVVEDMYRDALATIREIRRYMSGGDDGDMRETEAARAEEGTAWWMR